MSHNLFSFGTLRLKRVQLELFGREFPMEPDVLRRYVVGEVTISDPAVTRASGRDRHPALITTGRESDTVHGVVLEIDNLEIATADRYEEAAFRRVELILESGRAAWVYMPNLSPELGVQIE